MERYSAAVALRRPRRSRHNRSHPAQSRKWSRRPDSPRGKIALTLAVSIAALDQIARVIQAKLGNDVLGPTEAITIARQPTLGSEHAVAAARRDHAQKVGLVPKQAEAALHLPGDVKVAEASKLGESRIERAERDQERKDDGEADHAGWWRAIGPFTIYLAAEV